MTVPLNRTPGSRADAIAHDTKTLLRKLAEHGLDLVAVTVSADNVIVSAYVGGFIAPERLLASARFALCILGETRTFATVSDAVSAYTAAVLQQVFPDRAGTDSFHLTLNTTLMMAVAERSGPAGAVESVELTTPHPDRACPVMLANLTASDDALTMDLPEVLFELLPALMAPATRRALCNASTLLAAQPDWESITVTSGVTCAALEHALEHPEQWRCGHEHLLLMRGGDCYLVLTHKHTGSATLEFKVTGWQDPDFL